ncbi:sigma-70 family RNA polymerase sigma factor [Actinoplanes sp. NPDC049599]|uniref:sigma-70 family RNA polymerase sigma factor n=1 Tax=Actinoplanes sp. NPDC049599 TaxID=3363903 RepID=UPI00378F2949
MTQSQAVGQDLARLVRDAQAGSAGALDELVAEHLPLVYNIIGRALHGHPDVDDVVQETMLRSIRALPTLREPNRYRSWLVAIAYRQIQLHLRSRIVTRQRRAAEPADLPDPEGDFAERATAELVVADQRRELVEAVGWLDAGDRTLLGLWWQESAGELTRSELASALRVPPKHAAVRVQRMKAQLDAARGVVRALRARPRCAGLSGQLRRWDGAADPLWRKRLVRHVRECPQCGPRGRGLLAPEELLLGFAALPVPVALLAGLKAGAVAQAGLSAGASVLAHLQALLHHKALAVGAAATIAVGGGVVYAVHQTDLPRSGAGSGIALPELTTRPLTPEPARPSASAPAAPGRTPTARPGTGLGVQRADIYVAPDGKDSGDGSLRRPYASLQRAVAAVRPGQTIALRGGTYRPAAGITITTSGTAAERIMLSNYRDERPVIDATRVPADQWAITQQTAYWTVQGLELRGSRSHGYVCRACRDNVFRRLSLHDNVRSGMLLRDPGTTRNQVLDSDFSANRDPSAPGRVGIGLGVQFGAGAGNLIRGNRAFSNGSTGIDLGSFGSPVTVEYTWSYGNGASGFALGGSDPPVAAAHRLRHDAAWDNAGHGFTDEGNPAALELSNSTAFRNRGTGFALLDAAAVLRANAAVGNADPESLSPAARADRNSWQQQGWSAAKFRSTDPAAAQGARTADGKLPGTDFLTTGNGVGASMAGGS